MMKVVLGILVFTTVILSAADGRQNPASDGWCRVYVSPDRSEIRFFYEDGRYAWLAAAAKRRKDGTYSATTSEDYTSRTGTWRMQSGEIESHEFWVHIVHIRPALRPLDEHYSLKGASGFQTSKTLHLQDPGTIFHTSRPSEDLILINLYKLKQFQQGQIYETCTHAKESPQDVAQEWLKFCQ